MAQTASKLDPFPIYRVCGSNRELGRQHGEQARSQIQGHLESIQRSLGLDTAAFGARAMRFYPLFQRYCPHLLDEIDGLAAGAGISPAGALAVNVRGALGVLSDEACTAFVVGREGTADRQVLIGQNSDMLPEFRDHAYVLSLEPDDAPPVLIWTFGGMIGYHGINAQGLAQMANDLGEGGPPRRFAMPHYAVKRMMLECTAVDQVVDLLNLVPLWFNGNYVLSDGSGRILDIEATSAGPQIIDDHGCGYIAHANHYCSPCYATPENAEATYSDSFPRQDRMNSALAERYGEITVDMLKGILADHANYPSGICRHPTTADPGVGFERAGATVASLIAEPERGLLHIAPGNPCMNDYTTYSLQG